jgi:hypothetical protein
MILSHQGGVGAAKGSGNKAASYKALNENGQALARPSIA